MTVCVENMTFCKKCNKEVQIMSAKTENVKAGKQFKCQNCGTVWQIRNDCRGIEPKGVI